MAKQHIRSLGNTGYHRVRSWRELDDKGLREHTQRKTTVAWLCDMDASLARTTASTVYWEGLGIRRGPGRPRTRSAEDQVDQGPGRPRTMSAKDQVGRGPGRPRTRSTKDQVGQGPGRPRRYWRDSQERTIQRLGLSPGKRQR